MALRVAAAFAALEALRRLPASRAAALQFPTASAAAGVFKVSAAEASTAAEGFRAAALQLPTASAAAGVFKVSAAEASTAGEGFRAAAEPSAAGTAAGPAKRGPLHPPGIDHRKI